MIKRQGNGRETERWYVLRGHYLRGAAVDALAWDVENRSQEAEEGMRHLELFAPRLEPKRFVDGRLENGNRPFIGYIFVKGMKSRVQQLCRLYTKFNMVRSLSDKNEYITVSDSEMRMFQFTVSLYNGHAPFVEISKETLEKGDYVRIRSGHQFANVEGILLTSQGKEGGRVVVSVFNGMAIPTLEIRPEYLEVLSFGKDNRHIYQTLDSYHPIIRRALIAKLSCTETDEKDMTRIKNFVSRYGNVDFDRKDREQCNGEKGGKDKDNGKKADADQNMASKKNDEKVENKKIRGRYYAYMLMSYVVLDLGGDAPRHYYTQQISQVMPHITNPTTKAFILCVLYVATKGKHYLDEASAIAATWEGKKLTKKQREVDADIKFYKELPYSTLTNEPSSESNQ